MKEGDSIILIIVFSLFLMVLVFTFLVMFNKYHKRLKLRQKEALNNLILGQDTERERIARDLHDELGSELSSIIFLIDEIETQQPEIIAIKIKAKLKLKEATEKIRIISHDLIPVTLSRYGLVEALSELENKSKIELNFSSNCENLKIENSIQSHLYRIVNELIHNSVKHSGASSIVFKLNYIIEQNQIELSYKDNGKGFGNNMGVGIGIKNIKTRVHLMNGTLNIDGNDGFNCKIIVNNT
jgi:signal transduction histidine kinase